MHSIIIKAVWACLLLAPLGVCQGPRQDLNPAELPFLQASDIQLAGLQQVPSALVPQRTPNLFTAIAPGIEPGHESCNLPVIRRPRFTAVQVVDLVQGLKNSSSISSECSVMPNLFVACMPDLALVSGCCSNFCQYGLRLALTPQCLAEFWDYICKQAPGMLRPVADTLERCLPPASDLPLNCPANVTTLEWLRSKGMDMSVGQVVEELQGNVSNATFVLMSEEEQMLLGNASAAFGTDAKYYEDCRSQPTLPWPELVYKPGSYLLSSQLAIVRGVADDLCVRTFLSLMPVCFDDLQYQSGCCSLSCRVSLTQVPLSCWTSYIQATCTYTPNITNYLLIEPVAWSWCNKVSASRTHCELHGPFHIVIDCYSTEPQHHAASFCSCVFASAKLDAMVNCLAAQGVEGPVNPSTPPSPMPEAHGWLPVIIPSSGTCPIKTVPWPDFHAFTIFSRIIRLIEGVPLQCKLAQASTASACANETAVQEGCCTDACVMAMRKVPNTCYAQMTAALCQDFNMMEYAERLGSHCLGTTFTSSFFTSTATAGLPANTSQALQECHARLVQAAETTLFARLHAPTTSTGG